MADGSELRSERAYFFGPFQLIPSRQLLLERETPVPIGSRALEILIALLERPGELIGRDELLSRVWPDTTVEASNLKVQVAALRRRLERGVGGHRYIATVSGRGYRFVAPVERAAETPPPAMQAVARGAGNLPRSSTRVIGRGREIDQLLDELPHSRLLTIVGPGGIGKTTVALAAAAELAGDFRDGAWFVELASLREPQFVPSALASALGLASSCEDAVAALIAHLRDRRMLIVLDNCEHLVGAAAAFAEQIIAGAPGVHVLATSREPLRARNERVHRLPPLESPPGSVGMTAGQALAYPAIELFVERAVGSQDGFELSDADAPVVAEICRKLDGIALAIELAATRTDAFGVRDLLALLDDRFRLLGQGRRAADARQQTLAATLDWSHGLLSGDEQTILRRLSVFAGAFTLESARAVAAGAAGGTPELIDGLGNLVAKSLISADVGGAATLYRLLDSTRAYALQKLAASGEHDALLRRHAEHHRDVFERASAQAGARPTEEWVADYGRRIDDVRSALDWAFSGTGDAGVGIALTIAAIPLWMQLSLLDECQGRVERALAVVQPADRDEMKLLAALGSALIYTRGPLPETGQAWSRALAIAERLGDTAYRLRTLWGLSVYRVYTGEYRSVLELLRRYRAVAARKGDAADLLGCERLMATALHYCGEQAQARRRVDHVLARYAVPAERSQIARFQFDQRVAARGTLANTLWLQGFPEQAVGMAQGALEDALAAGHPISLCTALGHSTFPIALYVGDLAKAGRQLAMLQEHLAKHAFVVWNWLVLCLKGTLLLRRDDPAGLPLLRNGLEELRGAGYRLRYSSHLGALAQGLGAAGRMAEAHATIDEALEWTKRSDELWFLPELLRIRGELFRAEEADEAAEQQHRQAIDLARRQGARAWELRAATSLARLWQPQGGGAARAEGLLRPVYGGFGEGFETADLRAARELLQQLTAPSPPREPHGRPTGSRRRRKATSV